MIELLNVMPNLNAHQLSSILDLNIVSTKRMLNQYSKSHKNSIIRANRAYKHRKMDKLHVC